jgi:hypothetical protein
MTSILVWVALGLAAIALAQVLVHALRATVLPLGVRPAVLATVGVLTPGFLITLPTTPPWSPGQTAGVGLLAGGATVLFGLLLALRLTTGSPREAFLRGTVELALPSLVVGLLLVAYSNRALDVLIACCLGALAAGILLAGSLRLGAHTDTAVRVARTVEAVTVAVVALAATTYLATFHRSPAGVREWQPLPVLFTAVTAAALALRSVLQGPDELDARAGWLRTALAVVLPLVVIAWLIGDRLEGTPAFFRVVLVGLGVFGLVAWLDRTSADAPRTDLTLLAGLVVLGGSVLAFRWLHGYGIGIAVLAGLAIAAAVPVAGDRVLLRSGAALGVLLLLYRVFEESVAYGGSPEPDFYYYHVALVLGALLPALLPASAEGPGVGGAGTLVRAGVAGLAAAVAPLVVWLLVGPRPQAALLVGVGLGAALLPLVRRPAPEGAMSTGAAVASFGSLLGMAVLLSAVQFTFLLEPLALWTRLQRISLLAGIAAVLIVGIGAAAFLDRSVRRKEVIE